jgi:DNA-binding transcriptional LysR family regulator
LRVHVDGQLTFNATFQMLKAALAGFGLACVPESIAQPTYGQAASQAGARRLVPVLFWGITFTARAGAAFALLVDALRYRAPA